MNTKRIIIEGKEVHNVGYRPFLLAKAHRLGIRNFEADNVEEGSGKQKVIVSVSGNERQVTEFTEFVKTNRPKAAKVSEIKEAKPPKRVMPIDEYGGVLAAEQQSTVIKTGLEMVGLQKHMLEKQDQMRNDMNRNFNTLHTKYGTLSERMASIDNTMKELGQAILALAGKKSS